MDEVVAEFLINKTKESLNQIIKWCSDNYDNIDFKDNKNRAVFSVASENLMKHKIGSLTKNEAKMLINFFAKEFAFENGFLDNVSVNVLDKDDYAKKINDRSRGICKNIGNGNSEVYYSSDIVDYLMSNDKVKFIRGLQTIFHEVTHAKQNYMLFKPNNEKGKFQYEGNTYKCAVEDVLRRVHPKFYHDNYKKLASEFEAEYVGIEKAMEKLGVDYSSLDVSKEEYLKGWIGIDEKTELSIGNKIKFDDVEANSIALINLIVDNSIQKRPEFIEEYPALKYAYNLDGNKKSITELIQDREKIKSELDEEEICKLDDLYNGILSYRVIRREDINKLENYIIQTKGSDEFYYDLLKICLTNFNFDDEKIDKYISFVRKEIGISKENDETNKSKSNENEEKIDDDKEL